MPRRSSVATLPAAVKGWLDKALVENGFGGYEVLAAELKNRGFVISKSSLHRYGQQFDGALAAMKEATEQAKAIVEACPDDAGTMNDALIRLVQEKIFKILMNAGFNADEKSFPKLGKLAAELGKASVSAKKFMADVREKAQKAVEAVSKVARKGGLSDDAVRAIEETILGIAR